MNRREIIIAGAAGGLLAAAPLRASAAPRTFPKNFLWGAATAGHQIEGNNNSSDMWFVEHRKPTIFVEPSGDACNSFELWPTDLDLAKRIGLNSFRFSIEWSRVEPEPGAFSMAMLDHYKAIIDGCRARGLMPFVTFNHFTTPLWFAVQGGWTNPQAPGLFARFCERAAKHLAPGIGYAATLNEPNTPRLVQDLIPAPYLEMVRKTYQAAGAAAGSRKFTLSQIILPEDADVVARNLIAGHKAGRAAIKGVRADLPVGVCLSVQDDEAVGPDSLRDAKRQDYYAAWFDAAKGDDFLGVQNYLRNRWGAKDKLPDEPGGPRNGDGAQLYAPSLANAVRYAHQQTSCPIMVTEHGVQTPDDTVRAWFIPEALKGLKAVVDEGVPVLGYMHWSLLDNFEWSIGYRHQYGLASVDRTTFKRTLKPSASVLGTIARRNAV